MEYIINKTQEYITQNIYTQFTTFQDFLESKYFDDLLIHQAGKIHIDINIIHTNNLNHYIFALYLNCMQYHIQHNLPYNDAITIIRKITLNMFLETKTYKSQNTNLKTLLYHICIIFSYTKQDTHCKTLNQCLKSNLKNTPFINAGDINSVNSKLQQLNKMKFEEQLILITNLIHLIYIFIYNATTFNIVTIVTFILYQNYNSKNIRHLDKDITKSLQKTITLVQQLQIKFTDVSISSISSSYNQSIPLLTSTTSHSHSTITTDNELIQHYTSFLNYMIDSKKSQYYMKINNVSQYSNYMKKYDIYYLIKNGILYPPNILDTLTILDELSVFSYKKLDTYGSDRGYKWIFNLFDILNLNILYLYQHENKYYLSPLQNKKTRDKARKIPLGEFHNNLLSQQNYDELLQTIDTDKHINCLDYHFVLIHNDNYLDYNSITEVKLFNLDTHKDFRACYILNLQKNHIMSISKCNHKNIVNTTWEDKSTNHIENLDIFPKNPNYQYFWISKNETKKISKKEVDDLISKKKKNKLYIYKFPFQSDKLFKNFAIFVPSNTQSAGTTLPDNDTCKNIFFEINRTGTCWFTSLINTMFFSDDISPICLHQSIKAMPKTIRYINKFVFTNQKTPPNNINIRKHVNHMFYLITFMYSSYYILSKNKYHTDIKNKTTWHKIMNKITNPEFNTKLTLFLITTNNIT